MCNSVCSCCRIVSRNSVVLFIKSSIFVVVVEVDDELEFIHSFRYEIRENKNTRHNKREREREREKKMKLESV